MSGNEQAQASAGIASPPALDITIPKVEDINPPTEEWKDEPTEVVLLTVKDPEFLSCYFYLDDVVKSWHDDLSWVFFGDMRTGNERKVKISLVRCFQGATTPGAAITAVQNAVRILRPKAVVCVGYCGALNLQKTKLGDVVLSAKLATYSNTKRTSEGVEVRATIVNVSKRMKNLILCAKLGWKAPLLNTEQTQKPKVHCMAELLSGPELVLDSKRRQELLNRFPNSIAIEMEGEGVYSACQDLGVEWAVIKGISDYADDTKPQTENWKPFASAMAASVVNHIFCDPNVLTSLPHYRETNRPLNQGNATTMNTMQYGRETTNNSLPQPIKPHITFTGLLYFLFILIIAFIGIYIHLILSAAPSDAPVLQNAITSSEQDPLTTLLQSLLGGDSGQVDYKGRIIKYKAQGRVHSLKELWVFDGEALDVGSGISYSEKHFKQCEGAVKAAITGLITKLKNEGILQD